MTCYMCKAKVSNLYWGSFQVKHAWQSVCLACIQRLETIIQCEKASVTLTGSAICDVSAFMEKNTTFYGDASYEYYKNQ